MTKIETLKLIKEGLPEEGMRKWSIQSDWVYSFNKKHSDKGEVCYIDLIANEIIKKENLKLSLDEISSLRTLIYNANQRIRDEKENQFIDKMKNNGWDLLTEEIFDKAIELGKKILINHEFESLGGLMCEKRETIFRPCVNFEGKKILFPPKAKRRGFYLNDFLVKKSMYKIIK